jgi:carbon monoxide dehydrogenase subunit G
VVVLRRADDRRPWPRRGGDPLLNHDDKENEMARYTGTATAPHPPEEVWRYLADLRSVAEWDPSVESARLVAGEPRDVGSRYEIRVGFVGGSVTLPYELVEADSPRRVVFEAETDSISVRDEASIRPAADGGSEVTWDADLRLKGPRRLLDLPLRAAFGRIGSRAEHGLRARLLEPVLVKQGHETARAA